MKKLVKLKKKINNNMVINKKFGFKIGIYDFLNEILFRRNNLIGKKIHRKRYKLIKQYLKEKYNYVLKKYENANVIDNISDKAPIFIMWWQGEENAPEVVKVCIKSIKKHSNGHPVIVISERNYKDYVDIPDYIIDKVKNKIITLTHFSDIIRVALLYKNGGIWIDSTFYMTNDIKNFENYSFYTIHHGMYADFHVSRGLWHGGFLAAGKGNPFMHYMYDAFCEYWKNEDILIGYLLIDCFMSLGYENIKEFKDMIDKVPINNSRFDDLTMYLNRIYTGDIKFGNDPNNYIYKTTYKIKFEKYIEGKETYFNRLLENKL